MAGAYCASRTFECAHTARTDTHTNIMDKRLVLWDRIKHIRFITYGDKLLR